MGLMLCGQVAPAEARRYRAWPEQLWNDVFRDARPKRRRAVTILPVPLPQPRPADAPVLTQKRPADRPEEKVNPADAHQPEATPKPVEPGKPEKPAEAPESDKPAEKTVTAPPASSACRLALTDAIAVAPSIPDIHGSGGCGGEDLVRLEAVILADKSHVAITPAAVLRCTMASALVDWVRTDMAPLAAGLGTSLRDLDNFDSFECRGRNRVVGAKLSEHGRANAIDVRALKLANGQSISLTDRTVSRELRETVLHSVCARFSTVLGPGSDWYHEDHIHLDLMERRGNYKICQWNVYDPMPAVAPLLPEQRPDDAPPREAAVTSDSAKPDAATPAAAQSDAVSPQAEPSTKHYSIKKRRQTGAF
jgi:hypothetical protein